MVLDPRYADAISGLESGGKYDAVGPATKGGDHAYGRFQVMGANIPQWTQQFYGKSLSPQEFLANPQAQDAVFQGKFGQYAQKYGPEGAARAWFAGEGGMNNPNAKDVLGTTVQGYGQKFAANLGPSYAGVNSPPLTSGTQAPPLPPPTNIAGAPISGPQAPAPMPQAPASPLGVPPGLNLGALAGLMGGGMGSPSQMPAPQAPQAPPLPQNPIGLMAMMPQQIDTSSLQALLKNSPALRGLLT
jgi:hypothetical protein